MPRKGPDQIDMHVGRRVKMRRVMLGMSQSDLAEGLGITFQQVQKYENGINRIGSGRLHRTADILKVPISFFFEGVAAKGGKGGRETTPSFVTEFLSTSQGIALAQTFTSLNNAKLRRAIVELVENLARK